MGSLGPIGLNVSFQYQARLKPGSHPSNTQHLLANHSATTSHLQPFPEKKDNKMHKCSGHSPNLFLLGPNHAAQPLNASPSGNTVVYDRWCAEPT